MGFIFLTQALSCAFGVQRFPPGTILRFVHAVGFMLNATAAVQIRKMFLAIQ
jgi:hypothetical protein